MSVKEDNKKMTSSVKVDPNKKKDSKATTTTTTTTKKTKNQIPSTFMPPIEEDDLPPLALVFIVLFCSGFLLMFSLRDYMMTGRNIFGSMDESFLIFTKSTDWYENSKGWKSTQGGFSAIQQVTTDENNMGGFFVRKFNGAIASAIALHKIIPLVFFHGASWRNGHYRPLLLSSTFSNLAQITFFLWKWNDLLSGNTTQLPQLWITALMIESMVFLYYLWKLSKQRKGIVAIAMKDGKTPFSLPSRIVSRTIWIVSSIMTFLAIRDLFFPGTIIEFLPRDDIYLEWTNSLRHSPPLGSPESYEYGLESPLFVGDKFVSQYMALNLLLFGCYKFVSSYMIRYGTDGRGDIQTKMFWICQAIGNAMMLIVCRLFASAARSASLDLRWHLVALGYETFVLFLYGFF